MILIHSWSGRPIPFFGVLTRIGKNSLVTPSAHCCNNMRTPSQHLFAYSGSYAPDIFHDLRIRSCAPEIFHDTES
jgi:hypothetical protein